MNGAKSQTRVSDFTVTHALQGVRGGIAGLRIWVFLLEGTLNPSPTFLSALPAVTEMTLFISVFGLKKKPF